MLAVFQAHDFLYGGGCSRGLALVILQPRLLLVVAHRLQAEPDLLFRLAHLNDFEVVGLSHMNGRLFHTAPAGMTRHLRPMAESFDAFGQLDKRAETGHPANFAVYRIPNLMILEVAFPGIRLELFDPKRKPVRAGI